MTPSIAVVASYWLAAAACLVVFWPRINASRAWRLSALGSVLGFSLLHQLMFSTVAEDAYITFRYAQNLAEGNGPVFNVGEHVEGYSNFLWMLLVSVPHAIFGRGIVLTASVLGVVCTLGCVALAYLLTNRVVELTKRGMPASGVAVALVTAATTGLAAYGTSGLETPLFLLLTLGLCYAVISERAFLAGLLAALVTMTRPDGVLVALLVLVWLVMNAVRGRSGWRAPVRFAVAGLLLGIPWTVWRIAYYGHFLPNAVAAKSGGALGWQVEQGWSYVSSFGVAHQAVVLIAVVGFAATWYPRRRHDHALSAIRMVFTLALGYTVFVTVAGGDWMPDWRLLAPIPPLLAVASAATYGVLAAQPTETAQRRTAVVAVIVSGLSFFVSVTGPNTLDSMHEWRTKIAEMQEIGSWLGDSLPDGTVISTWANGALSYRAGPRITVVDVLGLTDEHIAREGIRGTGDGFFIGHAARDYAYVVYQRRPEVAVTANNGYFDNQYCGTAPEYPGYVPAAFHRDGSEKWITVYLRPDRSAALATKLDRDARFTHAACPDTTATEGP